MGGGEYLRCRQHLDTKKNTKLVKLRHCIYKRKFVRYVLKGDNNQGNITASTHGFPPQSQPTPVFDVTISSTVQISNYGYSSVRLKRKNSYSMAGTIFEQRRDISILVGLRKEGQQKRIFDYDHKWKTLIWTFVLGIFNGYLPTTSSLVISTGVRNGVFRI